MIHESSLNHLKIIIIPQKSRLSSFPYDMKHIVVTNRYNRIHHSMIVKHHKNYILDTTIRT